MFFGDARAIEQVYAQGRRERVAALTHLLEGCVAPPTIEEDFARYWQSLGAVEAIFATWGMPELSASQLDAMPNLRAVFYAAGSVRSFAEPLLERGITLVSAWQANAIPVAEFVLAQILLAGKGYWANTRDCASPQGRARGAFVGPGNFGETVALLGAGAIGRRVIELLRPFSLRVVVFDPFLPEPAARELGVEKVSLYHAFERGLVVSNHLASNTQTVEMLSGALFARMRPHATFINTGRGQTVDEKALIQVLSARPDLCALLDVTYPKSPAPDSPLYSLPNVHLTSHIAGSLGDETVRLADYAIEEFIAWRQGFPLRFAVNLQLLETMA